MMHTDDDSERARKAHKETHEAAKEDELASP
jgi:hypothetical protein